MRIIDAHTGRDVQVGDTLPIPGGGWYKVVELSPNPLARSLNAVGYTLFGHGLVAPKIRVASDDPSLDGQWIPLMVRRDHPSFPGEVVGFIPS